MSKVDVAKYFYAFNEVCKKSSSNKIKASGVVVFSNGLVQNNKWNKSAYLKSKKDDGLFFSFKREDAKHVVDCIQRNDYKGLLNYATYHSEKSGEKYRAALSLHENGFEDESDIIMDSVYEDYLRFRLANKFSDDIKNIVSSNNQSAIASKPRNPHYKDALSIAVATWERYPGASRTKLCNSLHHHFNGKVSIDRLEAWIKKAGIQPPRPKKNTSFTLVIPD